MAYVVREDSFKIASTTIVGQFPEGNSVAGASDMSGNVWEWTNSWYDPDEVYRVVRGGSWNSRDRIARCACRSRYVPGDFDNGLGFRVRSPGSISEF